MTAWGDISTTPDFPEDFKEAGPMYAAIPLGEPWLNAATRGETTHVMESPFEMDPDRTDEEAQAEHEAYAGHSAFLDRADAVTMADARDGVFTRWDGLTGHNDATPARLEAEQAELSRWENCGAPEAEA